MACINESQNDTLDEEKWDMVNIRKGGSLDMEIPHSLYFNP